MFEIISPNVKLIVNHDIPMSDNCNYVRLHDKGVIEIQLGPNDRTLGYVKKYFDTFTEHNQVYPVSVTGLKTSNEESKTGSERFCAWNADFAAALTNIVYNAGVVELVSIDEKIWEFRDVSKYFRFMRYAYGGEHFPHYDSDFEVRKEDPASKFGFEGCAGDLIYATKYSLVMYFNDCDTGEIAFINHDGVDKSDWDRQATDEEIFLKIKPQAGKIVLFPHDLCHTVLPFTDPAGERYIVRGDLIFTEAK